VHQKWQPLADSLSDILEVKVPVEPANKRSKRDQHLGKRWMYVHKELLLDILGSETTKVYFIESTISFAFKPRQRADLHHTIRPRDIPESH